MATPASQIRIAELDYDQILQNLVEFMKADPAFSDYDFSGSGLRLLSRVLAYVTFYNNYYLSSAVNEAFLDTAQLRSSVVSHARMLGYASHGVRSASYEANVVVVVSNTSPSTITLSKNTQFVLQSNSQYTFYNTDDVELTQNATSLAYEGTGITLVEGRPARYRFVVDTNDPTQRFIIPNANVDFSRLSVQVFDSSTSNTSTVFAEATNLLLANSTSNIYLVNEAYNGYPELKFGNDVVGRALHNGNVVLVDYYISRGLDGNNIRGPFRINDSTIPGLQRGVTATPDANTVPSLGGSDYEDIENIRYLAPLTYATQNRCVTADDYKAVILQDYSESISAITVFGGENGNPNDALERPAYGRVYIAIKPVIGIRLTEVLKNQIVETVIKPHSIVGVVPEIVDPDYIYLIVNTQVKYDPRSTTRTKQQLASAVAATIDTYAEQNIEKFNTSFRFSRLTRAIDDTDIAISSSLTRIELQKRIYPVVGDSNSFVVKFGGPLLKSGTTSAILPSSTHRFDYAAANGTVFTNCILRESNNIIQIIGYQDDATHSEVVINENVGTLDTTTGVMTLSNFAPEAIENDAVDVWIHALPLTTDLTPSLNRMYTVDANTIVVSLFDESQTSTATGFYQGGVLR